MTFKNWVDKPRIVQTSSGWSVRIEGCDVFDVVNQYGVKPRRAFDVVSGLKTEQDAKDFLMGWLRDQLPAEQHQGEPSFQNKGIKAHDGQKLLVQHILDNDKGLSDSSRMILEKLIEE